MTRGTPFRSRAHLRVMIGCSGSGHPQRRARALQILRGIDQDRPSVGNRVMELSERDIEGGQGSVRDGALAEQSDGVPGAITPAALGGVNAVFNTPADIPTPVAMAVTVNTGVRRNTLRAYRTSRPSSTRPRPAPIRMMCRSRCRWC